VSLGVVIWGLPGATVEVTPNVHTKSFWATFGLPFGHLRGTLWDAEPALMLPFGALWGLPRRLDVLLGRFGRLSGMRVFKFWKWWFSVEVCWERVACPL
jgi:hypothetical protein